MEKALTEELLQQLNLIKYDRSKTLIENHVGLINEQNKWPTTEEGKSVIKFLIDLGHDRFILQGSTSANNAYNLAAVSAMRKLTEKLVGINITQTDSFFRVTVLNKKPSGGVQKFSSFDNNLIDKLNNNIKYSEENVMGGGNGIGSDRTVGGTFILEDFYFNYGMILNTVKDLNIYNNYLFPDGVYNFFTQFFGGDNVKTLISKIETQNVTNRPKLNSGDGYKQISYTDRVTNETDWAPIVEALHIILPAASFVLNVFGGPPGMVVGAGLEVIDAGLYQFYDEDPYMAGLSLVFALVPLGELSKIPGFKEVAEKGVKEGLEGILWKQVRKQALTAEEEMFVKSALKNKKVQSEFYNAVISVSLRKLVNKNPRGFLELVFWLYSKGMLSYSKYATIVNLVLGTVAYDYWAYHYLGKCSASFKFSDLFKLIPETRSSSVQNLIRQIEIQPFTSTEEACEAVVQIQLAKEREKLLKELTKNYQKLVVAVLNGLITNKLVLSVGLSNSFEIEVAMIQTILFQCGFSKRTIDTLIMNGVATFRNASSVKKVVLSTVQGRIIETILNDGKDVFYSKSINPKDGVILALIHLKGKDKPIVHKLFNDKALRGVRAPSNVVEYEKFNWGFYDEKTKKSVEEFQTYFKLNSDGIVGYNSLNKLLRLVKGQSCGQLTNHSGMDLTQVNEDLLNAEIIKKYQESLVLAPPPPKFDPNNITPEEQKKIDEITNRYLKFNSQQEIDDTLKQIDKGFQ